MCSIVGVSGVVAHPFRPSPALRRPSLEEAFVIQDQSVALDYIGKRGSLEKHVRRQRQEYARSVLIKDLLPHVAVTSQLGNETKKAFFLGYIVHRLLQCSLGRRKQDDRDHVANKRMDLAGPLMANMFRILFYQVRCVAHRAPCPVPCGVWRVTDGRTPWARPAACRRVLPAARAFRDSRAPPAHGPTHSHTRAPR